MPARPTLGWGLTRWPEMYGIPSWTADGNNVLDVLAATTLAVRRCREGRGPAVVSTEAFRMGGHATHDETEPGPLSRPSCSRSGGPHRPSRRVHETARVLRGPALHRGRGGRGRGVGRGCRCGVSRFSRRSRMAIYGRFSQESRQAALRCRSEGGFGPAVPSDP